MSESTRKPGDDPRCLLRLSEQFLRRRHFDDCLKYAQKAHQLDPNFPGVVETLAVANVLLASNHNSPAGTLRDWYAIMQLDRYTHDSDLITNRYNHLHRVLNPSNNHLPFADEAFDIVCDAWFVLSNPLKKLEFDEFLKKHLDDVDDGDVFWTACPYCYYLYEYPRVYLELCLRCPNEGCGKAFTCVEIDRPPAEVLKEGKYLCEGFLMVGSKNGCWNPFAPLRRKTTLSRGDRIDNVNGNVNDNVNDNVVDISDDDEVEIKRDDELLNGGGGGLKMEVDTQTDKMNVGRKKSVAKNTKKVTGAGNRVRKQGVVHTENTDNFVFF